MAPVLWERWLLRLLLRSSGTCRCRSGSLHGAALLYGRNQVELRPPAVPSAGRFSLRASERSSSALMNHEMPAEQKGKCWSLNLATLTERLVHGDGRTFGEDPPPPLGRPGRAPTSSSSSLGSSRGGEGGGGGVTESQVSGVTPSPAAPVQLQAT